MSYSVVFFEWIIWKQQEKTCYFMDIHLFILFKHFKRFNTQTLSFVNLFSIQKITKIKISFFVIVVAFFVFHWITFSFSFTFFFCFIFFCCCCELCVMPVANILMTAIRYTQAFSYYNNRYELTHARLECYKEQNIFNVRGKNKDYFICMRRRSKKAIYNVCMSAYVLWLETYFREEFDTFIQVKMCYKLACVRCFIFLCSFFLFLGRRSFSKHAIEIFQLDCFFSSVSVLPVPHLPNTTQ